VTASWEHDPTDRDEKAMLLGFLETQQTAIRSKVGDIDDEQACRSTS
jgi:hypothetical protein